MPPATGVEGGPQLGERLGGPTSRTEQARCQVRQVGAPRWQSGHRGSEQSNAVLVAPLGVEGDRPILDPSVRRAIVSHPTPGHRW
ncbi:hypothetical protein K1W54_39365 [Micromonospora sp. CPCC 205371]|nr:hypothetical protein [Micromonospora sp. CPCC 205371]